MSEPARKEKMDIDRLLAAVHGDDPVAFREIYDQYLPNLRFGVRSLLVRVPRLIPYEDDIISRAWMRLLARDRKLLRSYDPNRASFGTFMSMVGANTAWQVAALRGHPTRNLSVELNEGAIAQTSGEADMESVIADRELMISVNAELEARLSERERFLLDACIIEGRTAKEVALELETSEAAIWTATSRLRKKLAEIATALRKRAQTPQERRDTLNIVSVLLLLSTTGLVPGDVSPSDLEVPPYDEGVES